MADVAIVTAHQFEAPVAGAIDWYVDNVLTEERLLVDALTRRGLSAERVDWARPDVDWSSYRTAIVRSTWDYFDRFDEFVPWIDRVGAATHLLNAPSTIRWNVDKHYLLDLQRRGIAIVATEIVEPDAPRSLAAVMSDRGWDKVVIKPTVSGAGKNTFRVDTRTVAEFEGRFTALLGAGAMIVQPFVQDVVDRGEVTVVVIDGEPTHALLKRPQAGEFRVQDDHGGTLHDHQASAAELALAREAIGVCEPSVVYGRVDMVADHRGQPVVMELELVEPELWFRRNPTAADALAEAIAAIV